MNDEATAARHVDRCTHGLGWFVATALVLWTLTNIAEMFFAGSNESPLPPPYRIAVRAPIVIAALLVGVYTARNRSASPRKWSWLPPVAFVVIVVASTQGYAKHRQADFLDHVPAGTGSHDAVLSAGDQACDWLKDRHWGRPSGPPQRAALVIKSTGTLFHEYEGYLNKTGPSFATRNPRVGLVAWYKLCPFQQWVHRPLAGSGD